MVFHAETGWYDYLREKFREGGPLLALMAVADPVGVREPVARGGKRDRDTVDGFARDRILGHGERALERYLRDQLS